MLVLVTFAAGLILASLERFPGMRFRRARLFRAFFASDVFYLVSGLAVDALATLAFLVPAGAALAALGAPRLSLPPWAAVPLCLLVLDLGNYTAHWLLHRSDVLWEIHKVHHSSATLDWLAKSRSHVLEQVFRRLLAPLALVAVGAPLGATIIAASIFNAWAMLIHANLDLDLRWLEPVLVTPRLHRLHHVPETTQKNLGSFLTVWDRLRRDAFVDHDLARDARFGVPDEVDSYPQGWGRQFLEPLGRLVGRRPARISARGAQA